MNELDSEVLSHEQARAFLKISKATLNRLCAAGKIRRRTLGRRSLFLKSDLLAALCADDEQQQQPN